MTSWDAIVVGAGPNGLVAANVLADAGWSVLVLEAEDEIGGAVRSDRELHPDFVQDTFSAFYPLAAASRAMLPMQLEQHGLVWEHAPAVLGHVMEDGGWALLHRDRDVTARLLDEHHRGDGAAWLQLCETWDRIGGPLIDALTGPFPPLRAGGLLGTRIPRAGGLELVRTLLSPVASLARHRFGGQAPGLLLAGNAGHADLPLSSPGSGAFAIIMTMLGQTVGFPVPRGGAGELSATLGRRLQARGGEVVVGARVTRVDVRDGRACGVRTDDGERYAARYGVLADVAFPRLFGTLLDAADVPAKVQRGRSTFELDPGTVKVDWALDSTIPWSTPPPYAPGTVHVGDSVDQMAQAMAQVAHRTIPSDPFLLLGQMTTADPSRSPAGTESCWAYTHVPQPGQRVHDAGDGAIRGVWDADDCERFADRMQDRIERLAPGFGSRIVARRVLGPAELEARNANLVGGAINGGTSQLHQEAFFRPVPGLRGRPETGVRGLYLASAAAHPGGGVHGAAGANAARAAIWHRRLDRLTHRPRARHR